MGFGFFNTTAKESRQPSLVARCWECRLHEKCKSPKMPVYGRGERKILIVGEAPGPDEDAQGEPFFGRAGQKLRDTLKEFGVVLGRDCWTTNTLICFPWQIAKVKGKKTKTFRAPTDQEIAWCRPNLIRTIKELNPEVIILLGGYAVASLIGWLWKEDVGSFEKWDGWQIPSQRLNAWICPTWHPSYILRNEKDRRFNQPNKPMEPVERFFWRPRLEAAFKLSGRPWKEPPNYVKEVSVEVSHSMAACQLEALQGYKDPIAFDFETDRLKPDHPDARIVCCAVTDGSRTLSYPWHGEAIEATKELLASPVPKIGWNIKFEDRWCRRFGIKVKNWVWDGMLAAHVLDNRSSTTGLKFQSFVRLGQESYDDEVHPYLAGEGGNGANRIRNVPLDKLLLYCGMDALLEYKVSEIQRKELDYEPARGNG